MVNTYQPTINHPSDPVTQLERQALKGSGRFEKYSTSYAKNADLKIPEFSRSCT